LLIIKKTKHLTKGKKKVQHGRTQVLANEKSSKKNRSLKTMNKLNTQSPLIARSVSNKEKRGTH
jgi:hypothetical protein